MIFMRVSLYVTYHNKSLITVLMDTDTKFWPCHLLPLHLVSQLSFFTVASLLQEPHL